MTRARRLFFLVSICALAVPPNDSLHAQGRGHAFQGLQQYTEITFRDLPGGERRTNAPRATPLHAVDEESFSKHKRTAATAVAPESTSTTVSPSVAIDNTGFDGVNFAASGALPPDTQLAVGPNHLVEAVNGRVRVWSRGTPPIVSYDVDLGTFFGLTIFDLFTVISDPRVIYDPATDRWFVSCVTLDPYLSYTGGWRIAVSKTNDPTGTYTLYAAQFNGEFPDFPSLGISDDKVALTGNAFSLPATQFLGSEFLIARKSDLVAGVSAPATSYFGHPQQVDTIQAAQSLSPTSTLYLAATTSDGGSTTLQVWSIDGVPGVGAGVSSATKSLTMQAPLVIPPDAEQPGTTVRIMTNDTRLNNLAYRNGALWMGGNTGCTPAGSIVVRSCLHFAQVDTATMTLAQEITHGEPGVDFYYPAVTLDASGNMMTVFTRSSNVDYASVYASGHDASDAPGTLQVPLFVHGGESSYDASPYDQRWGDYEGIAVDPLDGGATAWIAGQFMGAGGGMNWSTWIAQLSTGSGGGCIVPPTPLGLSAVAGDGKVTLAWSASTGATSYAVKRATVSGGPYNSIAAPTSTGYVDTGLTNGTTYYYVISASNSTCGESANSIEASATPAAAVQPVQPPTNLKATGAKRKVTLTWTQSATAGITQNRIFRSTSNGGPYTEIARIGANTSYVDSQVNSRVTYYYVVTALRGTDESAYSSQASATTK